MAKTRFLVLENGRVFEGQALGAAGEVCGEVVFTTGMTGYLETLSDPSYHGQLVVQTFPLIGNYGVIPPDLESGGVGVRAYIVAECCEHPSNFRSQGPLNELLRRENIVGLCGLDTRALVRTLREAGTMNGVITSNPDGVDLDAVRDYAVRGAVPAVSCGEISTSGSAGGKRVALWDFGAKAGIIKALEQRGFEVIRLPQHTKAEEILALELDGLMLANGPGDPQDNPAVIAELRTLLDQNLPIFGICLGHQLLALAAGADTCKLKYGHRGANHPVRELASGRVHITSQNHGYAVVPESLDSQIGNISFVNANDGSCEGIDYTAFPAFTVQFHPEACGGPLDTGYLFDRFAAMMDRERGAAACR